MRTSTAATLDGVGELWARYATTRNPALREQLILQYRPLVKYVLKRMAFKLPAMLEFEDLLSFGTEGLIEAVERFDPSRSVSFQSFAILRIRGAILDRLRDADHLPRSVRQRARAAAREIARLNASLGREPSNEEVARALALTGEAYRRQLILAARNPVSLDALSRPDADSGESFGEAQVADPHEAEVGDSLERVELSSELGRAIRRLPERLQLLLSLYYERGLTLREVADLLEISESRVSQLQRRALTQLRTTLEARYSVAA